ncbi:uncharacterized protein Bfra_004562 [Botrytis fragariae]|uniref:Uncharacterized protein n=1 Tax=Botrytis fragariae TaxID=1964551 RepID=A0A8H6AVV5_9HELO|nr:uncharacterized protein Bfra_004562 [Botrytis fragariae]KAF5874551.1 hypothetical protein Bfra_004562 [Botrytis fragariae]
MSNLNISSSNPSGTSLVSGTSATANTTTEATTSATSSSWTSTGFSNYTGPANSTAIGHHGSSVSGGAIAGIAIATFIVGALLSSIGLWFYFRRKRASKNPWRSENGYSKGNDITNHGAAIPKDPETQMQSYVIAERADDSQLRHQMQNLEELIYQHVENHYITGQYTGTSYDFTATLKKCGYSERTEPTISTLGSLLGNSTAYNNALSRVRELSTHHISSSKSPEDASKDPSIAKVVNLLNSILQPFISPSSKSSQFENLASIIYQGRELGLQLLAQPGNWIFGWKATAGGVESNTRNQIVVFPSLEEVINKDGKERRRVVCEQEREII